MKLDQIEKDLGKNPRKKNPIGVIISSNSEFC